MHCYQYTRGDLARTAMFHLARNWVLVALVVSGLATSIAWFNRDRLSLGVHRSTVTPEPGNQGDQAGTLSPEHATVLELRATARRNLGLKVAAARVTDHWRVVTIPGVVLDRPGVSDRGVTSPAVGSVSVIHVFPGDTVLPGDKLVTIQLFSEYLQATQTGLFQASREIDLIQAEIERLSKVAERGGTS
ncbi:MAG: hypothetical protein AAGD07_22485, partial [Planctomycetota bacterium]